MFDFQERLAGKIISHIESGLGEFHDLGSGAQQSVPEIQMVIEDYRLVISNPIALGPTIQSLQELLEAMILEVNETTDQFQLVTNKGWFSIDLRSESYVGPEALVIYGPENLIIVWN